MMNKECGIIRDLMPLYIDKISSNESNELINSHVQHCVQCKRILETMEDEIAIVNDKEPIKGNTLEAKQPFKKIRNVIISLIIVILLLFVTSGIILFMYKNIATELGVKKMVDSLQVSTQQIKQFELVEDTTYSLTSDSSRSEVEIEIVVNKKITESEAVDLLSGVIDKIDSHSGNSKLWNTYNGYFIIRNTDHQIMFKGTKLVNKQLRLVTTSQDF